MTDKMIPVPSVALRETEQTLRIYRRDVPLGHQPAMLADVAERLADTLDALLREAAQPEQPEHGLSEPLHITHGPLMRHAAALLRLRHPVMSENEQVASELEEAIDGRPTPAGDPAPQWLDVARMCEVSADSSADEELRADVCVWSHDDNEHAPKWDGSCGVAWSFIDGDPCDNGMQFCPSCGKSLFVHRAAEKREG